MVEPGLVIERLWVWIPAGAAAEFSSPELTLCDDSYSVSVPQLHLEDTRHSARSAHSRLQLNTHTPLTQRSRNGLTMPLSRLSVGAYQETGSHATRQGTLSHSRLSSLSHCGLILAWRVELLWTNWSQLKRKGAGRERMVEQTPQILASEEKATKRRRKQLFPCSGFV